jgi:hypothetical protein
MRQAFCLSGHVRQYNDIISNGTRIAKDRNYDIYISTWNNKGITNTPFWAGGTEFIDPIDISNLITLYKPKKLEIENIKNYNLQENYNYRLKSGALVFNVLSMFLKIKNSFNLVDLKPKILIRSRFDINNLVLKERLVCEKGKIYGKLNPNSGLPSDVFFYGDYDTMLKCIPDINYFTEQNIKNCLDAEDIFKKYMFENFIEFVIDGDLEYGLNTMKF